jgi:Metallo-peptidase family M12B Reprolysin-like
LPEVAAWYGVNPLVFRSILLRDRTNKIDRNGRWFVEEEFQAPAVQESPEVINGTLAPLADTFKLQSKPGASRTVYLNFRGATLTGTAWNSNGNTLIAQPFHMTGEGAADTNFTNNELTRIQYIWQRVAEDFAPFDVNVTTQEPAADALTRSSSSDTTFGTTALITNRTGVYSCGCGGVAYVGIYANVGDFYKPALVFWDALGSGEKNVAEAISHEVGHNVGLSHDGTSAVGYYEGHGSGTTGWAPIMGVGYYQNLVQWSKGEYAGANQKQDDIQVIQNTGMPLRADDHGNTTGAATGLTGSSSGGVTSLRGEGVIERSTDIDYFSFTAGAGSATFTLSPAVKLK